jgi:hypothetical protein
MLCRNILADVFAENSPGSSIKKFILACDLWNPKGQAKRIPIFVWMVLHKTKVVVPPGNVMHYYRVNFQDFFSPDAYVLHVLGRILCEDITPNEIVKNLTYFSEKMPRPPCPHAATTLANGNRITRILFQHFFSDSATIRQWACEVYDNRKNTCFSHQDTARLYSETALHMRTDVSRLPTPTKNVLNAVGKLYIELSETSLWQRNWMYFLYAKLCMEDHLENGAPIPWENVNTGGRPAFGFHGSEANTPRLATLRAFVTCNPDLKRMCKIVETLYTGKTDYSSEKNAVAGSKELFRKKGQGRKLNSNSKEVPKNRKSYS